MDEVGRRRWIGAGSLGFLAGFIIALLVSVNILDQVYGHRNIWDRERGGLDQLNLSMQADKSGRILMLVVTEQSYYSTQSISRDEYKLVWGIVDKSGNMVRGNFNIK